MKIGMRTPSLKKSLKARTTVNGKDKLKKPLFLDMGRKAWDG